jgi:hypothetical protein
MTSTSALLAAALDYAVEGWHVVPLIPGTATPAEPSHPADECDGSDQRCRRGHVGWETRATTDLALISKIWTRPWGIGIACGPSGLLVVNTGAGPTRGETVRSLAHENKRWPTTWTVATPSGGVQRYYARPADLDAGSGALGLMVQTRGAGHYVVAPPTRTPAGVWDTVVLAPVVELPDWATRLLVEQTPTVPTPRVSEPTC